MTAAVSCGVVLVDRWGAVFVCRATGTQRWDLPKGLADAGEGARAAALREAWEEAGLRLPGERLADLGEFAYLPAKRLHLFALRVADDAFAPRDCRCRSFFPHRYTGQPTPEADAFAWKAMADIDRWGGKNLARVLRGLDWAALAALPEVSAIEVDVASP